MFFLSLHQGHQYNRCTFIGLCEIRINYLRYCGWYQKIHNSQLSWHTKFNTIYMTKLIADLYWCTQSCWLLVKKKLVLQSSIPTFPALSQEPISKPVTDSILFQKYIALHWPCLITSLLTISLLCVQERTSLVKLLTQVPAPGLISRSLFSSLASRVRGFSEETHQNGWFLCIFYLHLSSTIKIFYCPMAQNDPNTALRSW